MKTLSKLKSRARQVRTELYTIYFASKDPRTPWYAKAVIACVVGYALSPIDLIPDFIPVLGYLDDLLLIPAGILLAVKLIPAAVLDESRRKARETIDQARPRRWLGFFLILAVWLLLLFLAAFLVWRIQQAKTG